MCITSRRSTPKPSATNFSSASRSWTSSTSALPSRARRMAWPVPTAMTLTVQANFFSNGGIRASNSPESRVEVVEARVSVSPARSGRKTPWRQKPGKRQKYRPLHWAPAASRPWKGLWRAPAGLAVMADEIDPDIGLAFVRSRKKPSRRPGSRISHNARIRRRRRPGSRSAPGARTGRPGFHTRTTNTFTSAWLSYFTTWTLAPRQHGRRQERRQDAAPPPGFHLMRTLSPPLFSVTWPIR